MKKRQRRLTGVDEMVLSLSAKGLTHGEIAAPLAEVYDGLRADPLCDGAKDQTEASFKSAELRKL